MTYLGVPKVSFWDILGGGFKYVFYFHPYREDEPILTHIFQMGWFNHQSDISEVSDVKTCPGRCSACV